MFRFVSYVFAMLSVAALTVSCGTGRAVRPSAAVPSAVVKPLPALSHNDSLRFKMFFFEAAQQQIAGNYDAAYDLLRHSIGINPNAAEAYFMLSSYDGVFKGDSAALQDIEKASSLDPENNAYLERLAQSYVRTDNVKEAVRALEKLSVNSPKRADVLEMLAAFYSKLKDYDNVIKTMERLELLEGASEQIALVKMRAYSMQGKKQEELNELKALSTKYPNDMNYRVMTGNWLLQNGQPEEALKTYQDVLSVEPENASARMSIIDYYKVKGNQQKADSIQEAMLVSAKTPLESKISLMRQVVSDNQKQGGDSTKVFSLFGKILAQPQQTSDMAELYVAYLMLKRMPQDTIMTALERVLQISPDNAGARLQLIQTVWERKDFDRVITLSRQALDYNPDEMAFYYFLGLAYVQKDEDDKALDIFKKGVSQINDKSNPDIVSDFYAIMGDILHSKGADKEAFAAYDSCLQWKDDNFGCLNNYAYYLSEKNLELDKAERMSFRTVQAEPDNSTYLDTYAWILFKKKKYADALPYIDMAVKNDTVKSAVIIEHAGDINAMNGNIDAAVGYWKQALEQPDADKKTLIRKIKIRKYVEKK